MTPKQEQAFEKNARDAYASGNLPQWKREAQATYDSIASKKQKEIVARNIADEIYKETKLAEERKQKEINDDRRAAIAQAAETGKEERLERRLEARDDRLKREQAFKEYSDITTRIIPRLNDQIRNAKRNASEAPRDNRRSFEDEVAALEETRREEYRKANSLRAQLELPLTSVPKDAPAPSGSGASTSELPSFANAESAQEAANKEGKPIRAIINGRAATITPNSMDKSREEMYSRGNKFKDPELDRLRALIGFKDTKTSTTAYIAYAARVEALERKSP